MAGKEKTTSQVVREGLEKACEEFTVRVMPLGFSRTKKMFWTREQPHVVEFIHFHRSGSSYGAAINFSVDIRVHFGIRVLNDNCDSASLNGPFSDPTLTREGRYHLRFNAKTGSTYDRCVGDLVRFVAERGEPWFHQFRDCEVLIGSSDTPLSLDSIGYLEASIRGDADSDNIAGSRKLFGIKTPKNKT
ncbi:DUF4304 domain-containing protein [Roseibacillus persicicus]|nr:DUF4304 domain-containing protein [Roseibacillus persicicus]